jgi:hypothetical protein
MAIETRQVETNPGMVFETSVDGHADAPLVLMLHGFAFRGSSGTPRYLRWGPRDAVASDFSLRRPDVRPQHRRICAHLWFHLDWH